MPRQKKPEYTYLPKKKLYQKKIKNNDGKWICLYAPTPDELTEKILQAYRLMDEELDIRENPTVSQYAADWLPTVIADKSYKMREQTENALSVHIIPQLGGLYLREVRHQDCAKVMANMAGRSNSLQSKVLNTMRQLFEAAVKDHIISENPCDGIKAGGKRAKEKEALTAEQVARLEAAVKGTPAETFVLLGLYAGLRREEILGLKWDCVDLDCPAPHIKVRRALRWEHNQPIVSDTLKSQAAKRDIPIPRKLADHLRGPTKMTDGHVVGGAPLTQTQCKNLWRWIRARQAGEHTYRKTVDGKVKKVTITKELGTVARNHRTPVLLDFPVSPHILRHTYITNLIMGGALPKRVQYLAGHSDIKITLQIYTHLMDHSPEALQEEINKVFGG